MTLKRYSLTTAKWLLALSVCSTIVGCTAGSVVRKNPMDQSHMTQLNSNMQLAQASLAGGNYNSAISIYKDRLTENPKDFDLQLKLGETLLDANALDEASLAFKKACKLRDWSSKPFSGLARVALRQGQPRQAFDYFLKAASRDPSSRIALNGMAVSKDYLGLHNEAQELYRSLLLKNPEDLKVKSNLGLSMALGGSYDRAIKYLMSFASSPSAPPQARHNLSIAYGLAGELATAQKIQSIDLPSATVKKNMNYLGIMSRVLRCEETSNCNYSTAR